MGIEGPSFAKSLDVVQCTSFRLVFLQQPARSDWKLPWISLPPKLTLR